VSDQSVPVPDHLRAGAPPRSHVPALRIVHGCPPAGTILVALADGYASSKDLGESKGVLGDALTLAAAALYACYTITLKQMMPSENETDMMLFFGFLGVLNVILFGPIALGMQLTGNFDVMALGWHVCALTFVKGARRLHLLVCSRAHVHAHCALWPHRGGCKIELAHLALNHHSSSANDVHLRSCRAL
jgi:hypothetical protein